MSRAGADLAPSEVRERIVRDHERILRLLTDVESLAMSVASGDSDSISPFIERAISLHTALCEHLDLEDRVLAPALRDTPGFGKVREEKLLAHHAEQRQTLHEALTALSQESLDPIQTARDVLELIEDIRRDIQHEDRDLLSPNLLKDDPIDVSFTG